MKQLLRARTGQHPANKEAAEGGRSRIDLPRHPATRGARFLSRGRFCLLLLVSAATAVSGEEPVATAAIATGFPCPIMSMLPFTARGRPNKEQPVQLAFSHMAAMLMAIDHFNAKDPSVVPELAAEDLAECDVVLPVRLHGGRSIVADVSNHRTPPVEALLRTISEAGDGRGALCGVVAPFTNKAAEAAAIVTGAMDIPMVSYRADSEDFGRSHKFTLTAKIIADEDAYSSALLDYLVNDRGRNYIYFLYHDELTSVADVMDLAVQNLKTQKKIHLRFAFFKPSDDNVSLIEALERIQKDKYKTIIVALSRMRQWEKLHDIADQMGMTDPKENYVWISHDKVNLDMLLRDTSSVKKAKLLHGMGMLRVLDGFQYDPNNRFLRSWKSLAGNVTFVNRLNAINPIVKRSDSKNSQGGDPDNLGSNATSSAFGEGTANDRGSAAGAKRNRPAPDGKTPGYYFARDDYFQTHEPASYAGFMYDTIIALGIGKCRARAKELQGYVPPKLPKHDPKDGPPVYPNTNTANTFYNELVNVTFAGATGAVVLHNRQYYTRDHATMAYGMYNIRLACGTDLRTARQNQSYPMEYVLTSVKKPFQETWTAVDGAQFVYADGTTEEPRPLQGLTLEKWVSVVIVSCVLILAATGSFIFVVNKRTKNDSVWSVKISELQYNEPKVVIGTGTFGSVFLAEYRGTEVAVKHVIPPNEGMHKALNEEKQENHDMEDNRGKESGHHILILGEISGERSGERSQDSTLGGRSSFSGRSSGFSSDRIRKQLRQDFMIEMRQLSKLRHPCITTVMGAIIARNQEPLLVMEYMENGSLYDLLHNETLVFEGDLLLPILRDISQGVRFLHAATPPVVHADLKAKNILVDSKFRVKVADFGLSQKSQVGATGTPYWMAPEILRRESKNNTATDVYAFGMILYEVYSRKDPYEGESCVKVLQLVADPTVNKRPEVPSSCPVQVRSLMADCVQGQPLDRPSFEEIDIRLKRLSAATVEPIVMISSKQAKKEKMFLETESLLFDIFPQRIAEALRDGRKVEAESRELVTIFFSDIVGFTHISSQLSPIKISDMLDRLYNKFDRLSKEHDIFKVETIGDAYMAVTNLVREQPCDHVARIAQFSIGALRAAHDTAIDLEDASKGFVSIRCGFHSGPVVANVVGSRNPRYCLFGDTVNTASRMESNSLQDRIHCSETAAVLLGQQQADIPVHSRGLITVKGKGQMHTYWVNESPPAAAPNEQR